MNATEPFKAAIKNYLANLSQSDELIAKTLKKEGKNIDDCVTYILNTVKKSGKNGFADDEIFGMAIHYYDEDAIEVGKPIGGKVVVNHSLPKSKTVEIPKRPGETPKKEIAKPVSKVIPMPIKREFVQTSLF
jgi:hypothetical protein